jgi:hypothetical protein
MLMTEGWPASTIPRHQRLVFMPCSGLKAEEPLRADQIYTGVMWQTLRAHCVRTPAMLILSARHGVLSPATVIEPYNQRMTRQRIQEFLGAVEANVQVALDTHPEGGFREVALVGGAFYREVMAAILFRLQDEHWLARDAVLLRSSGGLGQQRAQLGAYLRALPD